MNCICGFFFLLPWRLEEPSGKTMESSSWHDDVLEKSLPQR